MSTIKPALRKRISILYPDKIVSDLKSMDNELYNSLFQMAKEENTSIKNLLEENGYSFSRKSIPQMYIEDYLEILKLYKDKKVDSLHEKDSKLYYKILTHAKLKNLTLKQYLNSLGFEYDLKKENVPITDIKKELTRLYKNKVVVNLSKLNPALYYKVYQAATKENKHISVFLRELGFSTPERKIRTRKTKEQKTQELINKNKNSDNLSNKHVGRPKKTETINTNENKHVGRPKKEVESSTKAANVISMPVKTGENKKTNTSAKKTKPVENNTKTENKVVSEKKETPNKSVTKSNTKEKKNEAQNNETKKNTATSKAKTTTKKNTEENTTKKNVEDTKNSEKGTTEKNKESENSDNVK